MEGGVGVFGGDEKKKEKEKKEALTNNAGVLTLT
jgi:hypothetical protein